MRGGESSAAAAGRRTHTNCGTALGEKFDTKVTLPSGKKPDAVDWANREVRELKPDNASAVARGERQVEWAAAGFVDTLLRCEVKPEVGYGNETAIQPGVAT
ncbi:MAG: hypothetical protein KGI52_15200 [Burkholderiales bacterium]|nr:hypothetical protein [Burkholderiales bacterium]